MVSEEGLEGRAGGSEEDVVDVMLAAEEVWGLLVGIGEAPEMAFD